MAPRASRDSDTAAVLAVAFHLTIWLGCLVVTVLHWTRGGRAAFSTGAG